MLSCIIRDVMNEYVVEPDGFGRAVRVVHPSRSRSRSCSSNQPPESDRECNHAKNHNLPQGKVDVITGANLNVKVLRWENAPGELFVARHEGYCSGTRDDCGDHEGDYASQDALQVDHVQKIIEALRR